MKTLMNFILVFLLGSFIYSCQKEVDFQTIISQNSTGSLAKDNNGNCLPITLNGIYRVNKVTDSTNYIDVSVNVTSPGNYVIKTDTISGIYFNKTATFNNTGLQVVRLKSYGTPILAGNISLTVNYNGISSCAVQLTVSPAGGGAATFSLVGAPGSCTTPAVQGNYVAGTLLNATNKILLGVNVSAPGDFTLTTTTANGFSFNATGTFTTNGPQTVTLSGTGTPAVAGTTTLSVNGAPAACSFTITVNSGTSTGTQFIAAYLIDTTLTAPFDTVGRYQVTYDAQNRPVLVTEVSFKPNGDSLYHGITTLIYTGADTFAQRKVFYTKSFSGTPNASTKTHYYVFSNNRMIRDSVVFAGNNNYQAVNFSYAGNTVIKNERRFSPGAPALYLTNSTAYQTFGNGNNTYQIDTAISHYANNNNPATYYYNKIEVTTSYVQNPNPFYQVYKASKEPMYYEEKGIGSRSAPQYLITQQIDHSISWGPGSSGNNLNQHDYVYSFRPDGYPLIAWYTFNNIGIITKAKMLFVYR